MYAVDELRTKTTNDMNQELEIIQEIEDIVSQEKMTPSKCTIVMTKLNLLRSLANSSNDIHNVSGSASFDDVKRIWNAAENYTMHEIGEICKGDAAYCEYVPDLETYFEVHYR